MKIAIEFAKAAEMKARRRQTARLQLTRMLRQDRFASIPALKDIHYCLFLLAGFKLLTDIINKLLIHSIFIVCCLIKFAFLLFSQNHKILSIEIVHNYRNIDF